jgi:hypothetical protein
MCGYLRLGLERIFGRPPSFPFSLAAFAFAFDLTDPHTKTALCTYVCLCVILYAHEADGTLPKRAAAGEAPETIRENRRTRRRTHSACH